MTRHQARSQNLNSTAGAAIVWLGVFLLSANLDRAVSRLGNLLCGAAREGLRVLPSIVLAAWQAMQAYEFDHHQLLACLLQILLSFWPLLRVTAGAI